MTRAELIARRDALGKWYHQVRLRGLVFTRPWNRETVGQWWNGERGFRKMDLFIAPVLGTIVPIKGATILECGANSGVNGIWALKRGASFYCGIEADRRYWEQSLLVRHCYWQRWKRSLPMDLLLGDAEKVLKMNWPTLRTFDMCWCLAFIYHIPKERRVPLLYMLGEIAHHVIFQGNGVGDEPDGRGRTSLIEYIHDAGMEVTHVSHRNHVRGLVVVARKP